MSLFQVSDDFYLDNEKKKLDKNKLLELREILINVKSEELNSLEDHRAYVNILRKLRETYAEDMLVPGKKFNDLLSSLLGVGADGLYHNELRFLYELIQNVDDCEYADPSNCELNIHFDFNYGKITFEYNELGFTPENVFSITGIAEAIKNISPEKIEIGEKGIGFKSVFGIAEKVLVQSGNFSFMLYGNNFTVPHEMYQGFVPVKGSRLTLFLKAEGADSKNEQALARARGSACRKIYDRLAELYCNRHALFNNNPILFLNKLSKIKFYSDSMDSLEFIVEKGLSKTKLSGDLLKEEDVVISSVVNSRSRYPSQQSNTIKCTRYTKPVLYDRSMCVSRYGNDTAFSEKKMTLQVVIPNTNYLSEIEYGTLYSFLPTQVRTMVPISCHIPFKLANSREDVDSQGDENAWFKHSRDEFARMLHAVYKDLAMSVKNSILSYVPAYDKHFFAVEKGDDKLLSLKNDCYLGAAFLQDPILYTTNGCYKNCREVFSFARIDSKTDPLRLYSLLNYDKELFISSRRYNVDSYNIEKMENPYSELFSRAIKGIAPLRDSLDLIDEAGVSYGELFTSLKNKSISDEMLSEISRHSECIKAINEYAVDKLKNRRAINTRIDYLVGEKNINFIIAEDEPLDLDDLDSVVIEYLRVCKFRYITAPLDEAKQYLIAENILVLSSRDALGSFANFCRSVGKNDIFSARMTIRAASNRLDRLDESLEIPEYMKLLIDVRKSIRQACGVGSYENYIKVIKELNADPQRFIRELLQNADDCHYSNGIEPRFELAIKDRTLTTKYNEDGFTKENVRAITAIGESTKKKILDGDYDEIGEKGVGFKTAFSVADKVSIYSNDFHFSLAVNTPTIPEIIEPLKDSFYGTIMEFKLRRDVDVNFTQEQILALCLSLRNLKDISFNNIRIHIIDEQGKRKISIGEEEYVFDVYTHYFDVTDERRLEERSDGGRKISKSQKIVIYLPEKNISKFKYYLYCGLPTSVELGVPFAIDVPFELDASRNHVLQNGWNEIMRREMYSAYVKVLEKVSRKVRIKVLDYVRFQYLPYGSQYKFTLFKNDEEGWLSNLNVITLISNCWFIPTYDEEYFARPVEQIYYYPEVYHLIMRNDELEDWKKRKIIDDPTNEYSTTLRSLHCDPVPTDTVLSRIVKIDNCYMEDEKFRTKLYKYLEEAVDRIEQKTLLRKARIIPIKGSKRGDKIAFVSYGEKPLYVDNTSLVSTEDYNVLETDLLSKNTLERILGVDINVMDNRYKKSLYEEKLIKIITSSSGNAGKYRTILNEFKFNRRQLTESVGVLLQYRESIPFLMETGEYRCGNVFVVASRHRSFSGKLINSYLVAEEAMGLAELMRSEDIASVTYEDLDISSQLENDDIEDLNRDYIRNGYTILEKCMFDGYISDEQVQRYKLEGIKRIEYDEIFNMDDFPSEPIKNYNHLCAQIAEESKRVRSIIKVKEPRTVNKIELPNGTRISIDHSSERKETLRRYKPSENTDGCFCQMCGKVKDIEYIEVNNLISEPKYYWPDMRISLCLECSKRFESLRQNRDYVERFYENIRCADVHSDEPVVIKIGRNSIKFTQKHLARIQEILKSGKI